MLSVSSTQAASYIRGWSVADKFQLHSWVRIDSTNKNVVIDIGAGDVTRSLTEGLYWFGFGGESNGGSTDESVWAADKSLLDEWWDQIPEIGLSLDYEAGTGEQGHLINTTGTSGHDIRWTQMTDPDGGFVDPAWFGATTDNDFTSTGGGADDVSVFPSTLCFVGHRTIMSELLTQMPLERGSVTDSGRAYWEHFAEHTMRSLRLAATGLPRATPDNTMNALRRWLKTLRLARKARRFYYWSDVVKGMGGTWSEDAVDEADRYGLEDLQLDPRRPVHWDGQRRYNEWNQEWALELPVKEYVT